MESLAFEVFEIARGIVWNLQTNSVDFIKIVWKFRQKYLEPLPKLSENSSLENISKFNLNRLDSPTELSRNEIV